MNKMSRNRKKSNYPRGRSRVSCRTTLCVVAALITMVALPWALAEDLGTSVTDTKHNLSASGPGTIKVAGETKVCRFCHTPHASNPIAPLWNRNDPGAYYQTYKSSTLVAQVGQPTGSSRLCLSCHDGTIALLQTYNSRNETGGTLFISSKDRGYIGTDLSDDHPISFVYDSALASRKGELADPSSLPPQLALDWQGQLQCTTCHNPHKNPYGKFLTMSNAESAMCKTCHTLDGWASASHATSSASLAGAAGKWDNIKATTVRQAACGSCHRPHTAGGRERLLRHEAEEDNCLSCHDGSVASKNIAVDLAKISVHPVRSTTGVHDLAEDPKLMKKHVECFDCHNSHRSHAGTQAVAPAIQLAMKGVGGVSSNGQTLSEASYEYEVCYKCHAGSGTVRAPLVDRVIINTNVAREFSPNNPSYHPVEAAGKNLNVPSLLQPYKTTSRVYCTSCHNSDTTSLGARGPHGSKYKPLLTRQYVTTDLTTESPGAYALCYSCHNRTSILADKSFSEHKKHIVDQKTPCSACHDPHGISATQAGVNDGTHLINFDRTIVKAASSGAGASFTNRGALKGSCTLKCHNRDHLAEKYPDN